MMGEYIVAELEFANQILEAVREDILFQPNTHSLWDGFRERIGRMFSDQEIKRVAHDPVEEDGTTAVVVELYKYPQGWKSCIIEIKDTQAMVRSALEEDRSGTV